MAAAGQVTVLKTGAGQLDKCKENISNAQKRINEFGFGLRAIYGEMAVSNADFVRLRQQLSTTAIVFCDEHLPIAVESMRSLGKFMDIFLTFGVARLNNEKMLRRIHKEASKYEMIFMYLKLILNELSGDVKEGVTVAERIIKSMELEEKQLQDEIAQVQKNKGDSELASSILLWVPVVNLIACPICDAVTRARMEKINAKQCEASNLLVAAHVIRDNLQPSALAFGGALDEFAGFFSIIRNQVSTFLDRTEEAREAIRNGEEEDDVEMFLELMCTNAESLKDRSDHFIGGVERVVGEMAAISRLMANHGIQTQGVAEAWLCKRRSNSISFLGKVTSSWKQLFDDSPELAQTITQFKTGAKAKPALADS